MGKKATGNVIARKAFFKGIAQTVYQPAAALAFGLVMCPGYLGLVTNSWREVVSLSLCTRV